MYIEEKYDENGDVVIDALGIADSISDKDKGFIADELQRYCDEKSKEGESQECSRFYRNDNYGISAMGSGRRHLDNSFAKCS